jgi:hypothetical protein
MGVSSKDSFLKRGVSLVDFHANLSNVHSSPPMPWLRIRVSDAVLRSLEQFCNHASCFFLWPCSKGTKPLALCSQDSSTIVNAPLGVPRIFGALILQVPLRIGDVSVPECGVPEPRPWL